MEKTSQWKSKARGLIKCCQHEINKTTQIGKKMLSASKTNTCMHKAYEDLGILVTKAIENGELHWNNPEVTQLLATIKACSAELEEIEKEMNKIKFSSGPVNTSSADYSERN